MNSDLAHSTRRLDSGTVVHVWSPSEPATAAVQLQHGFAEYAERFIDEYRELIPALVACGYEVWAMDMEGHGRSLGRRAVTDIRRAVREHIAVRNMIRQRGLPVLVVGHSLGGLVTAASIAKRPEGVTYAVLLAPVILSRSSSLLRGIMRAVAWAIPARQLPGQRAGQLTRDPAVTARAAADPLMYQGTTTFRVASTALDEADEMWRHLADWAVPMTILHGTQDESTDYNRSVAIVAAIGRPDVTLRTVEDGRHELLHDLPADSTIKDEVLQLLRQSTNYGARRTQGSEP